MYSNNNNGYDNQQQPQVLNNKYINNIKSNNNNNINNNHNILKPQQQQNVGAFSPPAYPTLKSATHNDIVSKTSVPKLLDLTNENGAKVVYPTSVLNPRPYQNGFNNPTSYQPPINILYPYSQSGGGGGGLQKGQGYTKLQPSNSPPASVDSSTEQIPKLSKNTRKVFQSSNPIGSAGTAVINWHNYMCLACCVLVIINPVFGLLALLFIYLGKEQERNGVPDGAMRQAHTSLCASVLGIIVTILIIIAVAIIINTYKVYA